MGQDNRRRAVRVECDLPIRLEGIDSDLYARIIDLSRTGLRLRMPGEILGVHRLSSLAQVTRKLQEIVGVEFSAELHYEMLGPLVRKTLEPSRIAKLDWEQSDVEVGCHMQEPLSDEEVGMLGVPLPAIGERETPEGMVIAGPQRRTPQLGVVGQNGNGESDEPFTAWLYPEPGKCGQPLRTETLSLTRGMAILGVSDGSREPLEELGVSEVIQKLDADYGTAILLRIVDGPDDVWAGPAELQEVDVLAPENEIRLGVSFGRELRSEELGRMGLPTPA